MSLNTIQKRGSAMLVSLPFRPWLSEPMGVIPAGSRISLLRYCSAIFDEMFGYLRGYAVALHAIQGKASSHHSVDGQAVAQHSLDGKARLNSP